ncbi:MAG: cytochrome C oxidase subunit IV family protein [Motiliproteus sp.]
MTTMFKLNQIKPKTQDAVWLTLMMLTLGNALIAESADPSLWVTVIIASSIAIKGRLVVERFMELHNAHRWIRFTMNLYFLVLPLMIVAVFTFPELFADMTRI